MLHKLILSQHQRFHGQFLLRQMTEERSLPVIGISMLRKQREKSVCYTLPVCSVQESCVQQVPSLPTRGGPRYMHGVKRW